MSENLKRAACLYLFLKDKEDTFRFLAEILVVFSRMSLKPEQALVPNPSIGVSEGAGEHFGRVLAVPNSRQLLEPRTCDSPRLSHHSCTLLLLHSVCVCCFCTLKQLLRSLSDFPPNYEFKVLPKLSFRI